MFIGNYQKFSNKQKINIYGIVLITNNEIIPDCLVKSPSPVEGPLDAYLLTLLTKAVGLSVINNISYYPFLT